MRGTEPKGSIVYTLYYAESDFSSQHAANAAYDNINNQYKNTVYDLAVSRKIPRQHCIFCYPVLELFTAKASYLVEAKVNMILKIESQCGGSKQIRPRLMANFLVTRELA